MNSRSQFVPADIVCEILLRLNVKNLSRLKCVSKHWSSLISSLLFQREHYRRRSLQDPLLLITQEICNNNSNSNDPTILLLSASITDEGLIAVNNFSEQSPTGKLCIGANFIHPIESCLGLVCIESINGTIIIFNPSTEEQITLPPTKEHNICIGFGYAASTKKFKVVRFFRKCVDQTSCDCEVFTLGTDNWRKATSPPYHVSWGRAPFFNGALYVMQDQFGLRDPDYIVAFDIESEEYKANRILFPDLHESLDMSLTKLGESLCLIWRPDGTSDEFGGPIELWLLRDDNNNGYWEKEYNIYLSSSIGYLYFCLPVGILKDGTIMLHLTTEKEDLLWCYDPKAKVVTQKFSKICSALIYVESFFSLK